MDADRLETLLDAKGELTLNIEEVDGDPEIHLADTTVHEGELRVQCSDGVAVIPLDRVTGVGWHKPSLADFDLE